MGNYQKEEYEKKITTLWSTVIYTVVTAILQRMQNRITKGGMKK